MGRRAPAAGRPQELRIETFEHERAVDGRENHERHRGDGRNEDEGGIVEREHGAEQHMQEIDIAASDRDDQNAGRERHQIKSGEACIFAQQGRAGDKSGGKSDRKACDKASQ